jgi:hypothetical protein
MGSLYAFKRKRFRNTRHSNFGNSIVKLFLKHPVFSTALTSHSFSPLSVYGSTPCTPTPASNGCPGQQPLSNEHVYLFLKTFCSQLEQLLSENFFTLNGPLAEATS